MDLTWTSYKRNGDLIDAVCFPRGCREQYLVHPGHGASTLSSRGIVLSGISHYVPPFLVHRRDPGYHVIMLSIDGTGELEMDGHTSGLERGDMFIAPSSDKVEYQYRANSPWWCVWFHLANDAVWSKGLPAKGAIVRTPYVELLATLAEQYLTERTNRYPDSYAALEAYANLIVLILDREIRHLRVDRKEGDLRLRLAQTWQVVSADLAYPWTTSQLARRASMSPSQFTRVVKRFYKTTPKAVLLNYRMQRARDMLSFTNHTLEAIAANVGYETAFALSRAFKRHIGMSPHDFRKSLSHPNKSHKPLDSNTLAP
jgi:AraC-like DNA-binding protein